MNALNTATETFNEVCAAWELDETYAREVVRLSNAGDDSYDELDYMVWEVDGGIGDQATDCAYRKLNICDDQDAEDNDDNIAELSSNIAQEIIDRLVAAVARESI